MKKISLFVMALLMMVTTSMAATKVAYIINTSYGTYSDGCSLDTDPILNALKASFEVEVIDLVDDTEADYTMISETYDVAVISEAMAGNGKLGIGLKNLVGMMPVVNTKAYVYTSGRWGWAAPANPSTKPTTGITVNPAFRDHALFKGLEMGEDGVIQLYDGTGNSNNVQGFKALEDGSPIDLEMVYATASTDATINTVHEVVMNDFKYVLVPLSSDNIETMLPAAPQLVVNAVNYVGGGDNWSASEVKIAYLYDSSYNAGKGGYTDQGGIEADPIFNEVLAAQFTPEAIDIKDFTAESIDTLNALCNYDVVVVSEAMASGQAFAKKLIDIVNRVPMLNLKSFLYKSGVWGVGAGANPDKVDGNGIPSIVVAESALEHELFANVEAWGDNNDIQLFAEAKAGNLVQGYTISEGSIFEGDECLATVGGKNAIHMHGNKNTYMLLPLSSDNLIDNITGECAQIIYNAIEILAQSKGNVIPCVKPTFATEFDNNATSVTITSATGDATIYYTVDGTDPTEASSVYTVPVVVTTNGTVVKAIAVKQGYDNSEVASIEVEVKAKAAAPSIAVTDGENGTKVVTMTGVEGTTIYYNLAAVAPTTASPVYTEPIIVERSTEIAAIAAGEGLLESDAVFAVAEIAAFPFRKDTLATVTFSEAEGFTHVYTDADGVEQTVKPNSKKYLWNEKKGWSYYYANGDSSAVNTDTKVSDFGNGWVIASSGQAMYYHGDGTDVVAGGYGPATSADRGFTKGGLQWAGRQSGDPYSGYLYSTGDNKFAGPFDVAVWLCAGNNPAEGETENLEICTSTDGTTWTLLDTVSVVVDKMVHRVVAHYDGNESVYLRFGYAGGYKTKLMMMQVQILGVGGSSQIELPVAGDAEVVAVQVYNAAGIQQNGLQKGLNIVRKLYANGAVEVIKVMK